MGCYSSSKLESSSVEQFGESGWSVHSSLVSAPVPESLLELLQAENVKAVAEKIKNAQMKNLFFMLLL